MAMTRASEAPAARRLFSAGAGLVAAGLVVAAVLVGTGLLDAAARTRAAVVAYAVVSGFALLACVAAARSNREARWAWGLLAAAAAAWLAGGGAWLLGPPPGAVQTVSTTVWLASVPVLVAALLAFPPSPRTPLLLARTALDGLIVATAAFLLGWTLWPVGRSLPDDPALLAIVLGGVAAVTVGLTATLRAEPGERLAPGLVSAGILLHVGGGLGLSLAGPGPVGAYRPGTGLDVVWLAAIALVGLGALADRSWPLRSEREHHHRRADAALPYVPVVIAVLADLAVGRRLLGSTLGPTVTALGLAFVLARQATVLVDRTRLQQRLEALLSERTLELQTRDDRMLSLLSNWSDLSAIVDRHGVIRQHTPTVLRVLGYQPGELEGRPLADLVHPEDLEVATSRFREQLAGRPGASATVDVRLRHRDGHWIDVEVNVTNLVDDPSVEGLVLNLQDASGRKAVERQLRHSVFRDQLTGTANRRLLADRIEAALDRDATVTLVALDIDGFRTVNDRFGQAVGDAVLREVAARLAGTVGPDALVARLGGDVFAVVLAPEAEAPALAKRLLDVVRAPLSVDGHALRITASAGVSTSDVSAGTAEALRSAEIAMYAAKERGTGEVVEYEPGMRARIVDRLELEADLRAALAQDDLELHYQPIWDTATGRLVVVEALARWSHPVRGDVPPTVFVPIAEASGVVLELDRWVLARACRQARAWWERMGDQAPPVAVNVSGRSLRDPSWAEVVADTMRETRCPAGQLMMEITETALVEHGEGPLETLHALRALGVRLALDDFGTGYSSLGRLRDFPVEKAKIDQSFIAEITSLGDAPIVAAIVGMAHELGLEVVAEGVETDDQLKVLRFLGCDFVQGWLFARAEPAELVAQRFPPLD